MKAVEISSLDLGVDGALVVTSLALALEDGSVLGNSWLAKNLRKQIEQQGPLGLDRILNSHNNGYFSATLVKHIMLGGMEHEQDHLDERGRSYLPKGHRTEAPHVGQGHPHSHQARRGQPAGDHTHGHNHPTTKPISHSHHHRIGSPGVIAKARVYVESEADVPQGSVAERGPRGGTYYEPRPRFKAGDTVVLTGGASAGMIGIITPLDASNPYNEGVYEVEIQSPYGDYKIPVNAEGVVRVARGKRPSKGQAERQKKRRNKVILDVLDQFGKDISEAKSDFTPPTDYYRNGYKTEYPITIGSDQETFNRYVTKDDIAIYVPVGDRQNAALSLKRLLNYVSKMPPPAVVDLRRHVKRVILSPIAYPKNPSVWGTMAINGDLTIYPDVKREGAEEAYGGGDFHGPNPSPSLPDVAVARVLTHEVGHAVDNHSYDLIGPYNRKVKEFWLEYERAGGTIPASDENMRKVQDENGIPPHPTSGWAGPYQAMKKLMIARYNATEPKIPLYEIPEEYHKLLPGQKRKESWERPQDYAWNDLPPKVRLAFLEEERKSKPVSGYAKTNKEEFYAEGYEMYRWGTLPSEHVLYSHFENLPKVEKWITKAPVGPKSIKFLYHRHDPSDWNNDEGLYHGHAPAGKEHSH